jgi:hypothetical protein
MRRDWLKLVALLLPVLTGCLSHTRKLQQPVLAGPVMNADALQLVARINQRYGQINTLIAKVDFTASVGGAHQGKLTDYTTTMGEILIRKPQMLRVVVLFPVLHSRAVDLASNGKSFTLLIPPKDKAIVGTNSMTKPSANPLENLRPDVFLDSILIKGISADQIVSVIHESTTTLDRKTKRLIETPEYDLSILSPAATPPANSPAPALVSKALRVIRFSRLDLLPVEQDIYNANGDLETQVTYGPYQDFSGTKFPSSIDINRPLDEYRIHLTVNELTGVNQPLTDEQFQQTIPRGYQVTKLD